MNVHGKAEIKLVGGPLGGQTYLISVHDNGRLVAHRLRVSEIRPISTAEYTVFDFFGFMPQMTNWEYAPKEDGSTFVWHGRQVD